MNLPTYEQIKPYIEKKLVSENEHPEDSDVRIFNYTQSCQFSRSWDDVTLQCRGLILNIKTGEVLARPFPKFFNYQEHIQAGKTVPAEEPIITDKLDGSLGILYYLNGKEWIATRGSFVSEQAEWATAWWRANMMRGAGDDGITHLFEIIYPANRIVVNYDFSGLVHLASLRRSDGTLVDSDWSNMCRVVRKVPPTSMEELAKMDEPNSEGFVLFYPKANLRLKIKFPEYVRLHKIMTGLSEIGIWEGLATGNRAAKTEGIPDELFNWIVSVERKLVDKFLDIERSAEFAVYEAKNLPTRKEQAARIQELTLYPGIAFAMLDEKHWEPLIWRMLRPRGSTTFKVDIDS